MRLANADPENKRALSTKTALKVMDQAAMFLVLREQRKTVCATKDSIYDGTW